LEESVADYRYLIVGGGMTGDAACRGIRDNDSEGSIGLVGEEPVPPYARPPLTKGLWQGKAEDTIWRGTSGLGVELHLGRKIVELDLDEHRALDDEGAAYGYERLLLATGGRPRRLTGDADDVVYFRTVEDYRRLRARATKGANFVVIGGGFIGSELAAALTGSGCRVTMVFPEEGIGARLFPSGLAAFVTDYYRQKGVEVLPGELVDGLDRDGERTIVRLRSGRALEADGVVAGLGIEPATELAAEAGLNVDDGIVVDEYGRANPTGHIFAAGDVARFPATALGGVLTRVEHENHANSHGRTVGANMAGTEERYDTLPFFYSDLFELGYEAVGEVDTRHETVARWAEPNRKGVVCYVDSAGRPRGFLLWDVWGKVDDARRLIEAAEPLDVDALDALL
jgi:3-phenylpropionate/trans-cinnamate dioxygenase ferredoxin reductase subunit